MPKKPVDWALRWDIGNTILTVFTLFVASMAYCAEFRGPDLDSTIGRQLFLYSKPYVGVMVTIHNSGGQAGSVVRGELFWDDKPAMVLTQKTIEMPKWTYRYEQEHPSGGSSVGPPLIPAAQGGKVNQEEDQVNTWLTHFTPITVDGKTSQSAIIWFTTPLNSAIKPEDVFGRGNHHLRMLLYDETSKSPIITKQFGTYLKDTDEEHLFKGSMSELAVGVVFY